MINILFKNLSYKIVGLCFKTHKELGRYCREKQYADRLEKLLRETNIKYQREFELNNFKGDSPKGNRVDFLIDNKIILELKAKNFLSKEDYFQTKRYLKGANLELGLIINFHDSHLKPKRVLNIKYL